MSHCASKPCPAAHVVTVHAWPKLACRQGMSPCKGRQRCSPLKLVACVFGSAFQRHASPGSHATTSYTHVRRRREPALCVLLSCKRFANSRACHACCRLAISTASKHDSQFDSWRLAQRSVGSTATGATGGVRASGQKMRAGYRLCSLVGIP